MFENTQYYFYFSVQLQSVVSAGALEYADCISAER